MPALTRTACKTRTRTLLNEPSARFFTEAELNNWCDDAVRDISSKTFCSQAIGTSITTTSGVATYAFPTTLNTSAICTLHIKTIVNSNSTSLEFVGIDMLGRVMDSDNKPKYTLWNENMIFIPTPQTGSTYTPYLILEARQTAAGSINLPNAYHHLVPLYMTAMGKAKRRDFDHASSVFQTYNNELNRIYQQITGIYAPTDDRQRLKDQAPTD